MYHSLNDALVDESLTLSTFMWINEKSFEEFLVQNKKKIKKLIYTVRDIRDSQVALLSTLKSAQVLEDLIYFEMKEFFSSPQKQNFDEQTANFIAQLIKNNPKLETFVIENCNLNGKASKVVINMLSNHPSIKNIVIPHNYLGNAGMTPLLDLLKKTKTLAHLNISSNGYDESGIQTLSKAIISNSSLIQLNIGQDSFLGNSTIGADGSKYLSKALIETNILQSLILKNQILGYKAANFIGDILTKNGSVTHLDLTNTCLGSLGIDVLSRALNKNFTLKELRIGGNCVGYTHQEKSEYTQSIADLMNGARYLESMDIKFSDLIVDKVLLDAIENTKVTSFIFDGHTDDHRMLANSLKNNKNLKSILIEIRDHSSMYYIYNLKKCERLEEILFPISYYHKNEKKLYEMLLQMPALNTLNLGGFSPKNGKLLGDFIEKKKNLKNFFLADITGISDIDLVIDGIEKNTSLIRFEAKENSTISDAFQFYLKRNKMEVTGIKEKLKHFEKTRHSFHDIKFHFQNNLKRKLENLE